MEKLANIFGVDEGVEVNHNINVSNRAMFLISFALFLWTVAVLAKYFGGKNNG